MSIRVSALSEPIKQLHGLLQAVSVETIDDDRWQYGEPITFLADPCGPASVFALGECVDGVTSDPYGADGKPSEPMVVGEACGFEVVYGNSCSARTLVDPDFDVRSAASRGLAAKEDIAVESAVWQSFLGAGLVDCVEPAVDVCPDAVKATQAVAAIENAFAECGQIGYIHMPAALLPHLSDVIFPVDGSLRTLGGSIIVAGQGYGDPLSDPESTSIFGTGGIRLFSGVERFSPDVAESERLAAVNASRNLVEWRAERSWAIGFDPCCGPFEAKALYC